MCAAAVASCQSPRAGQNMSRGELAISNMYRRDKLQRGVWLASGVWGGSLQGRHLAREVGAAGIRLHLSQRYTACGRCHVPAWIARIYLAKLIFSDNNALSVLLLPLYVPLQLPSFLSIAAVPPKPRCLFTRHRCHCAFSPRPASSTLLFLHTGCQRPFTAKP